MKTAYLIPTRWTGFDKKQSTVIEYVFTIRNRDMRTTFCKQERPHEFGFNVLEFVESHSGRILGHQEFSTGLGTPTEFERFRVRMPDAQTARKFLTDLKKIYPNYSWR